MKNTESTEPQNQMLDQCFFGSVSRIENRLLALAASLATFVHLIYAHSVGYLARDETRIMNIYHYVINTNHWSLNRHIVDTSDLSQLVAIPTATKQGAYAWLLVFGHILGLTPGRADFLLDALGIILFFAGWLIIFWGQSSPLIYRVGLPTLAFWTFVYSPITLSLFSGHTTVALCSGAIIMSIALLVKANVNPSILRVFGCGCLVGAAVFLRLSNLAIACAISTYLFFSKGQPLTRRILITILFATLAIFPGFVGYVWRKQAIATYGPGLTVAGWPGPLDSSFDLARLTRIIPWPINSIGLFDDSFFANSLYGLQNQVNWTVNSTLAFITAVVLIGLAFYAPRNQQHDWPQRNLRRITIWITLWLMLELALLAVMYRSVNVPGRTPHWTPLLELRYLDIPLSLMMPLVLLNLEKVSQKVLKNKARFVSILLLSICATAIEPQSFVLSKTPSLFSSMPNAESGIQSRSRDGRKLLGAQLFDSRPPILVAHLPGEYPELWALHSRAARDILAPLGFRVSPLAIAAQTGSVEEIRKACTSFPQKLAVVIPDPEHQDWPANLRTWIEKHQNQKVFSSDEYSTFIATLDANECIALP
ncbi:hypothetical protein Lepto7375DRAFT_3971 [Leptolyngbya sp. PCC 7375]|nr:hypothetical protein Lepto7375DRAFT_3971 [Leptolyngbya sp. PCC 7375]